MEYGNILPTINKLADILYAKAKETEDTEIFKEITEIMDIVKELKLAVLEKREIDVLMLTLFYLLFNKNIFGE